MTDEQFNEAFKHVHVPSKIEESKTLQDQVVFALAQLGQGTADEVVKKMEELLPEAPEKELIAGTHETLTQLFERGFLTGSESGGSIVYCLHKITKANGGCIKGSN